MSSHSQEKLWFPHSAALFTHQSFLLSDHGQLKAGLMGHGPMKAGLLVQSQSDIVTQLIEFTTTMAGATFKPAVMSCAVPTASAATQTRPSAARCASSDGCTDVSVSRAMTTTPWCCPAYQKSSTLDRDYGSSWDRVASKDKRHRRPTASGTHPTLGACVVHVTISCSARCMTSFCYAIVHFSTSICNLEVITSQRQSAFSLSK